MTKKILVVVDMQNDFIDGSLGTAAAQKIVGTAARRIKERKSCGYTVLMTKDTHSDDYLNTREGGYLPVPHCIKGSWGWEIRREIAEAAEGCRVYEKDNFASLDLLSDLEKLRPDEVEFMGLCTDICVVSNALGARARLPEARISVVESCCAGVTPESHKAALLTMKNCQIDVI